MPEKTSAAAQRYKVGKYPLDYGFVVIDEHDPEKKVVFFDPEQFYCECAIRNHVENGRPFPPPREGEFERILVLREGDTNSYFDVPNFTTLLVVALSIVKARHRAGRWSQQPKAPTEPPMSREAISKLPKGNRIREAGEQEWRTFDTENERYQSSNAIWEELQRAVSEDDMQAALKVLTDTNNTPEASWSIETLTDPEQFDNAKR